MLNTNTTLSLTRAQTELVLSAFPSGYSVVDVTSYRPGYMDFPARVQVQAADGHSNFCALKKSISYERLSFEAKVLDALVDLGLPGPRVLALSQEQSDENEAALVLTECAGHALPWTNLKSLNEADFSCRMIIEAVDRMHSLTNEVRRHEIGAMIPTITLRDELDSVVSNGGDWLNNEVFASALDLLNHAVAQIETDVAFSNGDYNPINFLSDGEKLTAWLDFEHAQFSDPYIGFAKFLMWSFDDFGWGAGTKAGLVERYLYEHDISRREFAPRLILRCVATLQRDVTFGEKPVSQYGAHLLSLIDEAMRVFAKK